MPDVIVVGGGLAGSEAAWQAASRGLWVELYEMRPAVPTGAHTGADLAELVCSNSLGSTKTDSASGLLKEEIRQFGSLLLDCALSSSLPAGGALAVDRGGFARLVTERITSHPNIRVIRSEIKEVPATPTIVASGPLTSPALVGSIRSMTSQDSLFFYDAIAPIVLAESLNMQVAYRASRFGNGTQAEGDYINCPLNREEYESFVDNVLHAERISLRDFEREIELGVTAGSPEFFEGCLPIEIIAARGKDSLAFGPMRPVGLRDPRTGRWPHAVVQLRQDDLSGSLYNLVGFQTNLTYSEQKRVLRLIPGLENAEFVRYGQMHRNTFLASPLLLEPTLQLKSRPDLFFAGQITGVEGYMGNIATGLLAGINMARVLTGQTPLMLPVDTMLGALCYYITHASLQSFQPMKANFGILPPLEGPYVSKRERSSLYSQRGLRSLQAWADNNQLNLVGIEENEK